MFSSLLKSHPFAVEAFFESSLVLVFAVPKNEIENLIPECLTPDLFGEKYGFIAVAVVQTKHLRPKSLPTFLGNYFLLVGYRIFVRYENKDGRSMRGLYILKSETDSWKMELLGNLFTHYKYRKIDISWLKSGDQIIVESADLKIVAEDGNENIDLPENSPFETWQQARKFAGPLPFTFTYLKNAGEVLIIEGVRENWKPKPVKITEYEIPFLGELGLRNAELANAFIVKNIPYQWKKGRIEKWKK